MSINNLNHSQLNNVIQPKHAHPDAKDKQKPLFLSRAQRFTGNQKDTPGPGAYDGIFKEKHTLDYRVVRGNNEGTAIASQHQWIFSSGRLTLPNGTSKYVGPGLYDPQPSPSQSSHSNWAKKQRFNETKYFKNPLGPGQYRCDESNSPKKEKTKQLSVFKSKSPRTFFEELISKQAKAIKRHNPEDEMQSEEVIKFDQTSYPIRKKSSKLSPVFLSKSIRPQLINDHSPESVGPGSYSLNLQRTVSQKSTGIISAMHYNINPLLQKKPELLTSKITPPGPGAYQTEMASSEVLKKKPLGIIAKEERFKGSLFLKKSQMPGPGEYMQKRYTMINQDEFLLKNKNAFARKPEKSHDFGTVGRTTLRNRSNVPFGQYNVQLFDINYKMKKQKEHYEKLKMMEVTLPAFNSKQHHQ